jgi:hypothetical protein
MRLRSRQLLCLRSYFPDNTHLDRKVAKEGNMPALTLSADLWAHIFKNTGNNKKKLSGFHSSYLIKDAKAKDLVPRVKRRMAPPNRKFAFYLCGWNFYPAKETPVKWSTMFPDDWSDTEIKKLVEDAVDYWNLVRDPTTESFKKVGKITENATRLKALTKRYHVHWAGQAKLRGYTFILGGMTNDNKVATAFPLMGANANFPTVFGVNTAELNVDVDDDEA